MPVDTRGTIIQRSQHRQRKFDGIRNWYFDHVMESLPLMLQAALLLLGCALSRYLWEIDTTVASVVLGFTGFGLLFYLFIVIAGVVSENCPYQTPAANFLRHIPAAISHTPILLHRSILGVFRFLRVLFYRISYSLRRIRDALRHVPDTLRHVLNTLRHVPNTLRRVSNTLRHPLPLSGMLRSAFSAVIKDSWLCFVHTGTMSEIRAAQRTPYGIAAIVFHILLVHILLSPVWLTADVCRTIIWLLVSFTNWVRPARLEPHTEQTTEQEIVEHGLDLHCVLWTLQTSVDGPVRQSALEYLATMTLANFDPTQFAASWFDISLKCVQVANGNVVTIQGSELLAEKSSLFCLHMLSHLVVADPMPLKVLEDFRQRFTRTFPSKTNFGNLPVSHTLGAIHTVFHSNRTDGLGNTFLTEGPMRPLAPRVVRLRVRWDNYQPSGDEHTIVARALVKFAQFGYKESGEHAEVPRWLLRFALHSLSQDLLPPLSVISDSLSIIAIDLGCKVPGAVTVTPLNQR